MNIETLAAMAQQKISLPDQRLESFRAENLAAFRQKGVREVVPDSYKFTKLESFLEAISLGSGAESSLVKPEAFPAPGMATLTFVNGEFLSADALPAGLSVRKIGPELGDHVELFTEKNALSHLHHALLQEGVVIEASPQAEATTPVRLLNIFNAPRVSAPTVVILAHPRARLSVFEETRVTTDTEHVTVSETYIRAAQGAAVEHVTLQLGSAHGMNHNSIVAQVERDAVVRSVILTASGRLNRNNLTLNLHDAGAHGESHALFLTNGPEHSDVFTEINHRAADTTSHQIAKGILDGESKGVFTGRIHIFPKAQRVASGQLNKNLLLSKKAQVHSQPQLEIFADDVKCSHGSTTGQLSPDEVFYFQARGIPEDRARNLLALGFGLEVVLKIDNLLTRERVTTIIREKLSEKFSL